MENMDMREERKLSGAESVIMKVVWHCTKDGQDITVPDLIVAIKEMQGIEYARTTVVTFLLKLSDKRFVETYRKGKLSYVRPTKSLEWYRMKVMQDVCDMWYDGNVFLMSEDMHTFREEQASRDK